MYAAAYLLERFGYELDARQQELEDFAVRVSEGTLEPEKIATWFEDHARRV